MSITRYAPTALVEPFIIAPAPGQLQQRLMIAPSRVIQDPEGFINQILSHVGARPYAAAPVIAQIMWFRGFLVPSLTIQTNAREDFSGRTGVAVTFGALVPTGALRIPDLLYRIFSVLERYSNEQFGRPLTISSVGVLAEQGSFENELWNADLLVKLFAEEFGPAPPLVRWPSPFAAIRHLLVRRRWLGLPMVRAGNSVDEVESYWRMLDARIGTRSQVAGAASHLRDSRGRRFVINDPRGLLLCLIAAQLAVVLSASAWSSATEPSKVDCILALNSFVSACASITMLLLIERGKEFRELVIHFVVIFVAATAIILSWMTLLKIIIPVVLR